MQYTEEQKAEHKRRFAVKRRNQAMIVIPVLGAMALLILTNRKGAALWNPSVVVPIAFAIILAGLGFSLYNWRCPACNKYLGRGLGPRFCPKCGVELC
ncbi:MAG TPA: hypothetical protein VFG76_11075 [Candidatus Polarisedimenticolia bacterium]|nr:hypothetical protein [Candidatus Polarisedimenticolia bacterium]